MIMRAAIINSITPFRPEEAMPQVHQVWEGGRYSLDVLPRYGSVPFTHGMWTASLTGIYDFVVAYPGLFFIYQVFEGDGGSGIWTPIALGGLHISLDPARPASTM